MIPVTLPPEPLNFDQKVRQKGRKWLRDHPAALASEYPDYWLAVRDDLKKAFSSRCAYLGTIVHRGDVDHCIPKSRRACLAYEWRNLRWADSGFNQRVKRAKLVLDPIRVQPGWLYLNPKSMMFEEGKSFPDRPALRVRLQVTLDLLNTEECIQQRLDIAELCRDRATGQMDPEKVRKFLPALLESLQQVGLSNPRRSRPARSGGVRGRAPKDRR